jgi:hypothetical protein
MTIPQILRNFEQRAGAPTGAINQAERELGQLLPSDYKQVVEKSDSLEGFVSEDCYVTLWPVSELKELNDAYCTSEFIPGFLLLGSDGGDTGYGFRWGANGPEYGSVPLIGMAPEAIRMLNDTLTGLIENLAKAAK